VGVLRKFKRDDEMFYREERMFAGRRGESVCRRGVLALGKVCGLCFGEGVKNRRKVRNKKKYKK
jgi:hypothetical protein